MALEKVAAFFDAFDAPNWGLIRELLRENPGFAQLTEDEVEGWAGIHKLAYMAMDAENAAERQAILSLVTLFRVQELEIDPTPNVSVVNLQTPMIQGEEKYGYSPAHIAADRRDQDMLRALLTQPNLEDLSESHSEDEEEHFERSNLWLRTYNGQTVMHFIVKNGLHQVFIDFLPRFLETAPPVADDQRYEPTINTKDNEGRTLLMNAAYAGQLEIFNALLLQQELDCRVVNNYGRNFLHYICGESQFDQTEETKQNRRAILESYIKHLGEKNLEDFFELLATVDDDDKTPLQCAYNDSKDPELIKFLEDKIVENLDRMILDAKPGQAEGVETKTDMQIWLESLRMHFQKNASSLCARTNNDRLQKLSYHTLVLQSKLNVRPDDQDAISDWIANTKDDLYTQVLRDRWKMVLLIILFISIFSVLGFAITLVSLKAPVWIAANSLSAVGSNLWVAPGPETALLSSISAASSVAGVVTGLVVSKITLFGERKRAEKIIAEASDMESIRFASRGEKV